MTIHVPISTGTETNIVTEKLEFSHPPNCVCYDCIIKRLEARIESLESALARIAYMATMSKSPANLFAQHFEDPPDKPAEPQK